MPARLSAAILVASLVPAAAAAQDYSRGSRTERVAEEIAREVEAAANAIGAVTGSVERSVGVLRFRGPERYAVERCAPYAERYGAVRIDDVRSHGRRSWRVYGTASAGGRGEGWRRYYAPRAFTCTVRDDGRVKFKTSRLGRY